MALLGGDRSRSLHFAGRRTELAALHARLEYVVSEQDPEDGLVLIDGIQGIGKTGLLREFARQAVSGEGRCGETEVVHLSLVAEEPSAGEREGEPLACKELGAPPSDLAATMLNSIPAAVPKDIQGAKREVNRAFAWIRRTVKRGPGFELRVQADLPLNQLLRESKDLGWWEGKALLLTIDEVQNIDGNGRRNLATLHEGKHGCPILVLCAGLQHSRQVLQDPLHTTDNQPSPTISRFSTLTLAMLSHEDAIEALRQSVLKASDHAMPAELAERIANVCMGFPQHLHGYVQAAVRALRTWDTLETREAQHWVIAQGDDARRAYYEGRLTSFSPDEGIALCQIAAFASKREGRISWRVAAEAADAADTGTTGRQLLTAAIQKGVVSLAEGSTDLVFPIPSLMNHLASRISQPG